MKAGEWEELVIDRTYLGANQTTGDSSRMPLIHREPISEIPFTAERKHKKRLRTY
jgi:hypothetical protein